jgi:hypothetical protein
MDQFLARHGSLVTWIIVTLITIGVLYGNLQSDTAALQRQFDEHKATEGRQLDRIEQQLQSLNEYLRKPRD